MDLTQNTSAPVEENDINNNESPELMEVPAHDKRLARRKYVPLGALLVLLGWLSMMFDVYVSAGCTFLGLIFSIVGVRIPAGPRRDIAITSIIAAIVLLIVLAAFLSLLAFI